jgi:arylformamidase
MNIIDISWPITPQMTTYKNEALIQFTPSHTIEQHGVAKTLITLDSHTGTHIDAPSHFVKTGKTTTDIDLDAISGPCVVLDLSHVTTAITVADLELYDLEECEIILFKTNNSKKSYDAPFDPAFVSLDASAADYCAQLGLHAIGFDYLGIERNQPTHATHTILFDAQITIIEGLRLAHVAEGEYFFICLPLAVNGLDGAPARAILVEGL